MQVSPPATTLYNWHVGMVLNGGKPPDLQTRGGLQGHDGCRCELHAQASQASSS